VPPYTKNLLETYPLYLDPRIRRRSQLAKQIGNDLVDVMSSASSSRQRFRQIIEISKDQMENSGPETVSPGQIHKSV
jgi:hypothetical protein